MLYESGYTPRVWGGIFQIMKPENQLLPYGSDLLEVQNVCLVHVNPYEYTLYNRGTADVQA